jgi:hypothetical protein
MSTSSLSYSQTCDGTRTRVIVGCVHGRTDGHTDIGIQMHLNFNVMVRITKHKNFYKFYFFSFSLALQKRLKDKFDNLQSSVKIG